MVRIDVREFGAIDLCKVKGYELSVAPRAGAWIETDVCIPKVRRRTVSADNAALPTSIYFDSVAHLGEKEESP